VTPEGSAICSNRDFNKFMNPVGVFYKQATPSGVVEMLNLYIEPATNGVVNIKPRRGWLFIETQRQ
jgi:hypothetical protein